MLEACGLRGFVSGGAQISLKHANFIENAACAPADAVALIAEACARARAPGSSSSRVQLLGTVRIPRSTRTTWPPGGELGFVVSRPHLALVPGNGLVDACVGGSSARSSSSG